ncbi:unnamed protein product [Allacma fusca]|uniref:Glutathione S-transferase n=1 Tax=Allacma fusca TaxID=39272 RepID=A0A8J2LJ94_9HEXA|nr:unnamed protein product [Allacma fusca]
MDEQMSVPLVGQNIIFRMGIDCYYNPMSSPSRAVLLTAKYLGVHMNLKLVNLQAGDHMKPEFLRMNPLHTIPTLDDDGFYLYESRAVIQYLANEYGTDEKLYPKNSKARFLVDQKLMFDQGTLYPAFVSAYLGKVFLGTQINPSDVAKLNQALKDTNSFLSETNYIAGNNLTIADFVVVTTLSTISACGHDVTSDYPAIKRYMDKLKTEILGFQELNQQGADMFGQFVVSALKK